MIYYQKPMHAQEAFKEFANLYPTYYDDALFPSTIELCETVLSLPMHPYLTEKEIAQITTIIGTVL